MFLDLLKTSPKRYVDVTFGPLLLCGGLHMVGKRFKPLQSFRITVINDKFTIQVIISMVFHKMVSLKHQIRISVKSLLWKKWVSLNRIFWKVQNFSKISFHCTNQNLLNKIYEKIWGSFSELIKIERYFVATGLFSILFIPGIMPKIEVIFLQFSITFKAKAFIFNWLKDLFDGIGINFHLLTIPDKE